MTYKQVQGYIQGVEGDKLKYSEREVGLVREVNLHYLDTVVIEGYKNVWIF